MEEIVKVVMVPSSKATRSYHQEICNHGSLGRELKISPKSHITFNCPGYKQEFFVESVAVLIGIGKDHTADLIMSKEAYEALRSGEEINVTTKKEFIKKFL